jgi:hypothetical protein
MTTGSAASQNRQSPSSALAAVADSRFSQYKLNPQVTAPGMVSVGAMKATRSGIIQAEVMKHESVLTGKIAPEEQKKYKNLR